LLDAPGWKIELGNRAAASHGIEIIVQGAFRQRCALRQCRLARGPSSVLPTWTLLTKQLFYGKMTMKL
jgi:hypothetical protein